MAGYNRVNLMGNLCADVELRYTPGGAPVCDMRVACNERFTTRDGQQQEETVYVSVVAWQKTAENCAKFLRKGSPVFVEGKIAVDQWEDRETGKKREKTYVKALNVQFLGRGESGDGGGRSGGSEADGPADRRSSRPGDGYMGKPARRDDGGNDAPPGDDDSGIPF